MKPKQWVALVCNYSILVLACWKLNELIFRVVSRFGFSHFVRSVVLLTLVVVSTVTLTYGYTMEINGEEE